jgi:hypothetical protein
MLQWEPNQLAWMLVLLLDPRHRLTLSPHSFCDGKGCGFAWCEWVTSEVLHLCCYLGAMLVSELAQKNVKHGASQMQLGMALNNQQWQAVSYIFCLPAFSKRHIEGFFQYYPLKRATTITTILMENECTISMDSSAVISVFKFFIEPMTSIHNILDS